jgi:hypothetical protein
MKKILDLSKKKKMPPKDLSPLEGNIHALLGLYFIDTNRG